MRLWMIVILCLTGCSLPEHRQEFGVKVESINSDPDSSIEYKVTF